MLHQKTRKYSLWNKPSSMKEIYHKKYGQGEIVSSDKKYLTIRFASGVKKILRAYFEVYNEKVIDFLKEKKKKDKLKIAEIARQTGYCRQTLYKYRDAGLLKQFLIDNNVSD